MNDAESGGAGTGRAEPAPDGPAALLAALAERVGDGHVLTDPDARSGYEVDWTGRFGGPSSAVVRPGTTEEVAAVVALCAAAGVPVIAQGGNTGLVGGGVPRPAARAAPVILSSRRLDDVGEPDSLAALIEVGAGATLAAVEAAANAVGLSVGVDLAARDSATVGGMVATNAGGINVVANGSMRRRVLGVQAVMADGQVLSRLDGLVKDNAGYDLTQLLAGSEGTLAIITRVTLSLVPLVTGRHVVLVGCPDLTDLLEVVAALRGPALLAAEAIRGDAVAFVSEHLGEASPLSPVPAWVALVELAGAEPAASLNDVLDGRPATLGIAAADRRRLWRLRESLTEAVNARGVPLKLDVSLPLAAMDRFLAAIEPVVEGRRTIIYGHVADGTLHVNVLGAGEDAEAAHALEDAVLRAVVTHGGSIASEHGVGVAKTAWLELQRDAADMATMRAVKRSLDPASLLNPGVLFADDA